ncbi:hypothetical protein THAOC_18318, partial [Thalassiosira oceanica]
MRRLAFVASSSAAGEEIESHRATPARADGGSLRRAPPGGEDAGGPVHRPSGLRYLDRVVRKVRRGQGVRPDFVWRVACGRVTSCRASCVQSREGDLSGELSGKGISAHIFLVEVARSTWKVAHSRALGPGIAERASEGPGKARKASIHRKFGFGLRQRAPFVGNATRGGPRSCRADELDEVVRIGRKVASRKALAELFKSLWIVEFRSTELVPFRAREEKREAGIECIEVTTTPENQEKKNPRHRQSRRRPEISTQIPPGA